MASAIPGPARDFVGALTQAVDTATSGEDVATYDSAITQLTTQPAGGRVLGDVLRSLLEDTHPDGFTSHDITLVVARCYRAAVAWLPPERVDVTCQRSRNSVLARILWSAGVPAGGLMWTLVAESGAISIFCCRTCGAWSLSR